MDAAGTFRALAAAAAICAAFGGLARAADPAPAKGLIEWGWDEPDTGLLRENVARMEEMPFDGLVFHAMARHGGKKVNFSWEAFGKERFAPEELREALADLKATGRRRLRDLFLRYNVTPGVEWFDDAAWPSVLANARVGAAFAREAGITGWMFDVEDYGTELFHYDGRKDRAAHPFAEYRAKVRERGKSFGAAVAEAHPTITLFLTLGYSLSSPDASEKDRKDSRYGLLADFLDGILESAAPGMKLVDGWEPAYPYQRPEQFAEARRITVEKGPSWSAVPEKHRRQVSVSFGLWMDYDWRKKGWDAADPSKNYFTPQAFETSVRAALERADRWVWIYTEKPRWWTREALPEAYVEALRRARGSAGGSGGAR